MRSRVYVTTGASVRLAYVRPVCLSYLPTAATSAGGFAAERPAAGDIDRWLRALSSNDVTARRSAANAGSVMLRAEGGTRLDTDLFVMRWTERAESEHRRPAGGRDVPGARAGTVEGRRRTSRVHTLHHTAAPARTRRYVTVCVRLTLALIP